MNFAKLLYVKCVYIAHKESEKDKQLEEEEKILQNISETRGILTVLLVNTLQYLIVFLAYEKLLHTKLSILPPMNEYRLN